MTRGVIFINTLELPARLCRTEIQDIIRSNINPQKSNSREPWRRKALSKRSKFLHKLIEWDWCDPVGLYHNHSWLEEIVTMLPKHTLNFLPFIAKRFRHNVNLILARGENRKDRTDFVLIYGTEKTDENLRYLFFLLNAKLCGERPYF